uniref:hypothetical protein n=1 Tax=Staphylococcus aureus TaxID=1280 RepID=UPI00210E7B30
MTIDEFIIKLAREAERHANTFCESISDTEQNHWFDAYNERFAALVRNAALDEAIKIIEEYRIPVGNSDAGELACEWTRDELEEIRD